MTTARASRGKSAKLTINPQNQNLDSVHRIVGEILSEAGCPSCGLVAVLKIEFLGDPTPDLAQDGVISVGLEGF